MSAPIEIAFKEFNTLFMFKTILFVYMILVSYVAGASSYPYHTHVSLGDRYDNGYPESKYNEVLDTLIEVYSPIIAQRGGTFHIMRDWSDGAVNMWAFRYGDEYWLEIPGGMARYHLINQDAFLLSACHEIGHLLGGAPFKGSNQQISLEGQSDYYAGKDCIERVLDQVEPYGETELNPEVSEACVPYADFNICYRTLLGALSLSSYYGELEKVNFPKLSTPSQVVVGETLKIHPPAQCRLDTFYAGFKKEERPHCWYKN